MGHKNEKTLTRQIQERYVDMLALGKSKRDAKKDGSFKNYIYSDNTLKAYMKHANYFANYCKQEHNCRTLEQCYQYADEWLITRSNLSPYTQKLEVAALAKLYNKTADDFVRTEPRMRSNITRSRGEKARDKHFSEKNHADLVEFCRATGLRRRELSKLTGDKLAQIDGKYHIIVDKGGKGGKTRTVPIIGDEKRIVAMMEKAGDRKVFKKVPQMSDIHGYRRQYAHALYIAHARDIKDIPKADKYICRNDLKGIVYDKQAMHVVTQALGHNRIDVIAGHYISP